MRLRLIASSFLFALIAAVGLAGEVGAKAPVASVGLFKNGLAVVRRTTTLAGPGVYRIDDLPHPVHGTFWIESAVPVTATATTRLVHTPPTPGMVNLQADLAGQQVEIRLRHGDEVVRGRVIEVPVERGDKAWDRSYEQPAYPYGRWGNPAMMPPQAQYLILDRDGAREYIELSQISRLTVTGGGRTTVQRRRPVLLLELAQADAEAARGEVAVTISYLSKGLSWAPSYRVDMKDQKRLRIEQQAVVRNEMLDLKGAEVFLISGFPSMRFSHVVSPLSSETSWAQFFQQLNQQFGSPGGLGSNVAQQVVMRGERSEPAMWEQTDGEGVDLHYHPIGRRTLAEGDAMSLLVASAETDYERIVEWTIPDTRDASGRYVQHHLRQQDPQAYQDAIWDCLRFRNPFDFPMTTAPAMVLQRGLYSGQQQSGWVSSGEETSLRITQALSIRARSAEQEMPGEREVVYVGRDDFRKVKVKGQLSVQNHRKEAVTLVILRQFSGDLLRADGEPRAELREEGVYSVNRRNELTWTLPLAAGEEKTLEYEYSVLVDQ